MKTKLIIFMILALLMPIGYAYTWGGNDNSDRISNDQAGVFSPGYLNAAKQQAYSIVNQNNQPKSWWDNLVDKIKNKTSKDVKEDANTKITPEVKKKTSSRITTQSQELVRNMTIQDASTVTPISDEARQQIIAYAESHGGKVTEYSSGISVVAWTEIQRTSPWLPPSSSEFYFSAFNASGQIILERYCIERRTGMGAMNPYDISATSATALSNGSIVLIWSDISKSWSGWTDTHYMNVIDNSGATIADRYSLGGTNHFYGSFNIPTIQDLGSGYFALLNNTSGSGAGGRQSWKDSTINIFGSSGQGSNEFTLRDSLNFSWSVRVEENDGPYDYISSGYYISSIDILSNGEIYLNMSDPLYSRTLEIPDAISYYNVSTVNITDAVNSYSSNYHANIASFNIYGTYNSSSYESFSRLSSNPLTQDAVSGTFKGLLANKSSLTVNVGEGGGLNTELIARLIDNSLGAQALAIPLDGQNRADQMNIALALANILKNPTDDQKLILDAVESLLADMRNLEEKAGKNPELNKAENDLLQMVATCLLAQGVPDLLKAGDIEGIKGIFKDLGQTKDKIMMDYGQSIKPYYSNIVKELSSNLAMLQLKGILSNKITEEELRNLEPKEIDKILESIRRSNDKSFEMEYLRQQDNKYRKEYVDPQNKILEANMKLMLGGFTKKITKALEDKR